MMKRKFLALTAILVGILSGTPKAQAWGVISSSAATMMSYLVYPVIETGNINYCISIQDPRFDSKRIEVEIQSALNLWLRYLPNVGFKKITLTSVSCNFAHLNLMVDIGPETKELDMGGFQYPVNDGTRLYSYVKIDTTYTDAEGTHKIIDFDWLVETDGKILADYLHKISFETPQNATSVANDLKVDHDTIYWTTYKIFIHEFGHSFGLCDTYEKEIKTCDPTLMSSTQPPSVMQNSEYFYLTEDDVTGFRFLFKDYIIK